MPTLLIVQVGLGRVVRESNVTATISERESRFSSVILDTVFTSAQGGAIRSTVIGPCLVDEEAPDAYQNSINAASPKTLPILTPNA